MCDNFGATYGYVFALLLRSSDRAKTAQAFAMSDFSATINQLMVREREEFDK